MSDEDDARENNGKLTFFESLEMNDRKQWKKM